MESDTMIDVLREPGEGAASAGPGGPAGLPVNWDAVTGWAMGAGRGLARFRNWVVDEALERHTAATLGAAFGLGVITGWLVKRR